MDDSFAAEPEACTPEEGRAEEVMVRVPAAMVGNLAKVDCEMEDEGETA